jgi:signal transduction histidine kinase
MAGALVIMALQRTTHLYEMLFVTSSTTLLLIQELIWLVIALLMVAGITLIAPLVQVLRGNEELRDVLKERDAIAREFHEEQMRTLRQAHVALEVGKSSNLVMAQVSKAIHAIQAFQEEMKLGLLVGNNFGTALRSLIEDMSQHNHLPIHVEADPKAVSHITKEQGSQLLHITREAIQNSQKHAQAKKGKVSLHQHGDSVTLEILDNGKGFEVDLVEAQGHGLGHMVARAKKIGARFKIHSQPKRGTRVQIELPANGIPA